MTLFFRKTAQIHLILRDRRFRAVPLQGVWLTEAGFTDGMPIKIRVMPDCIVITTQNTRELWGCAEGLSVVGVNRPKMIQWLEGFPGALNDTGDMPMIKRGSGHCG
ncbi:type I toxin-antitoxin system SymE family toxin [Phytobacter diazotrophicus]|nr:type I toxin-antitoxin system SymE family toxin [Phytobacter diazotrophicus]